MSEVYDQYRHTFVLVNHPKADKEEPKWIDEAWEGPSEILLHTGKHVWIHTCYSAEGHPDVKRVGDGRDSGYSQEGDCILSVPAEWCTFYTNEEADGIAQCIAADADLLAYARG